MYKATRHKFDTILNMNSTSKFNLYSKFELQFFNCSKSLTFNKQNKVNKMCEFFLCNQFRNCY